MATVTLQEAIPIRRIDLEGDMGMYRAHLFIGVKGGSSREDSDGFVSGGGGSLSEHPS